MAGNASARSAAVPGCGNVVSVREGTGQVRRDKGGQAEALQAANPLPGKRRGSQGRRDKGGRAEAP